MQQQLAPPLPLLLAAHVQQAAGTRLLLFWSEQLNEQRPTQEILNKLGICMSSTACHCCRREKPRSGAGAVWCDLVIFACVTPLHSQGEQHSRVANT